MIRWIFFLLGVGVLLPWNAYISAKPYFQARLCSSVHNIEFWFSTLYNGGSVLSLAVVVGMSIWYLHSQGYVVNEDDDGDYLPSEASPLCGSIRLSSSSGRSSCYKHRRTINNSNSNSNRKLPQDDTTVSWYLVMVSLGLYFTVFLVTTMLVLIPDDPSSLDEEPEPNTWMAGYTLVGITICGIGTSVASSGIVGTASSFPSNVGIYPYFQGQAVGGLVVATGNFGATVWHHQFEQQQQQQISDRCVGYTQVSWSTAVYFGSSCIVLACCMVSYAHVDRSTRSQSLDRSSPSSETMLDFELERDAKVGSSDEKSFLLPRTRTKHQTRTALRLLDYTDHSTESIGAFSTNSSRYKGLSNGTSHHPFSDAAQDTSSAAVNSVWQVWCCVNRPATTLFGTYFVTLIIFPVWTSELTSIHDSTQGNASGSDNHESAYYWFTPMTFIVFNAGDLLGRLLSSYVASASNKNESSSKKRPRNGSMLVLLSLARFAFVPLFLICHSSNLDAPQTLYSGPWYIPTERLNFQTDRASWWIQGLFAISNGYLTNEAFALTPALLPTSGNSISSRININRSGGSSESQQQVASAILNLSLCLGLFAGSLCSLPLLNFWTGINVPTFAQ